MRWLASVALSATAALSPAYAQSFPIPLTPERALSDVVWTGAAGNQTNPLVATNGEVSLLAWADERAGGGGTYASRVDSAGNVLDPAGVRLAPSSRLNAVVWNGESFVVVIGTTFVFVSPDMTLTTWSLDISSNDYLFGAATPGPDVRILYVGYFGSGGGGAAIVDGHGYVTAKKIIWTLPPTAFNWSRVTGASRTGFIVIHGARIYENPNAPPRFTSERLDLAANVLSSSDSKLPFELDTTEVVAGADDGFLLAQRKPGLTVHRLDPAGVYTGQSRVLDTGDSAVSLLREENRYVVAWQTVSTSGPVSEFIAEIAPDNSFAVRSIPEPAGTAGGIALTSNRGQRLLASSVNRADFGTDADVFVRPLTAALEPADERLVTSSGTLQMSVDVAGGANGFAVIWNETGPDALERVFVRRYTDNGVPQDATPIAAAAIPHIGIRYPRKATIASNGETYLLTWQTTAGFVMRRLGARNGDWIDRQPISLGLKGDVRVAASGTDAVAFASTGVLGGSLTARRISLTGEPLTSPVVDLKTLDTFAFVGDFAVESNGSGYLAVWVEMGFCPFPCGFLPSQIYAVRLRADGTVIDALPLRLDNNQRFQNYISIASEGGRYLVAWTGLSGPCGSRVTAEGAVLDRDAAGGCVTLDRGPQLLNDFVASVAAQFGKGFALVTRLSRLDTVSLLPVVTLTGVTFDASAADLNGVVAMPRTLLEDRSDLGSSLAFAAHGPVLAMAYDRAAQDAGGVSRAFFRLFAEPPQRRRSAAH